jgi:putative phosphoesterase
MRIAVLSDTHDRLWPHVAKAVAKADAIWHLGDVCDPAILLALKSVGPPVHVVRGNCDSEFAWPLTLDFELEGTRLHLEHIPARHPAAACDLFLHGHTHVPRDEVVNGVRFLNPGCITRPNRGAPASWAWLVLGKNQPLTWKLVPV